MSVSPQVFDLKMDELKKVYGANRYPVSREKAILEAVKDLSEDEFRSIIEKLICQKEAPAPVEFEAAAKLLKNQKILNERNTTEKQSTVQALTCQKCFETGVAFVYRPSDEVARMVLCNCKEGEKAFGAYRLPTFSPQVEKCFRLIAFPAKYSPAESSQSAVVQYQIWREKIRQNEIFWSEYFAAQGGT